jgi:hypothetical protein
VLVHLATIDLEALAELDVGLVDDFLEQGLTLEQRQFPQIVAVEVKQKPTIAIFLERPLSCVT